MTLRETLIAIRATAHLRRNYDLVKWVNTALSRGTGLNEKLVSFVLIGEKNSITNDPVMARVMVKIMMDMVSPAGGDADVHH